MGRDKALIRFEGHTLVERAAERLGRVCNPVLIASGARRLDVAGHLSVDDAVPGIGPLGGLAAALLASPHQLLAAIAVDMPWFDPALLLLLSERIGDNEACVPLTDRGPEPLHAVYARAGLPVVDAAMSSADHSLRRLCSDLRVRYVPKDEWRGAGIAPGFARNINTAVDLARFTEAGIG